MILSLYAQILPRLEVFFLEEWIQHHLDMGVDRVYLYNNGLKTAPTHPNRKSSKMMNCGKTAKDIWQPKGEIDDKRVWDKKPDADYFLDHSDEEIMNKLFTILEKFEGKASLRSWEWGKDHELCHPYGQTAGYFHCMENNASDWWVHIDPDEYFFSQKYDSLKEYLLMCEEAGINTLHFYQRVFKARERGRPVREIFNWGYDGGPTKSAFKSPTKHLDARHLHESSSLTKISPHSLGFRCTDTTYMIHEMQSAHPQGRKVPLSEFRFNHYRGNPRVAGGEGPAIRFSNSIYDDFEKIDSSMKKFMRKEVYPNFIWPKDDAIDINLSEHPNYLDANSMASPLEMQKPVEAVVITPIIGEAYANKVRLGTISKLLYCKKNSYDLIIPDDDDYNKIGGAGKKPGWLKVDTLIENYYKYNLLFLSDSDVCIMNFDCRLEQIASDHFSENIFMLITEDHNGLNSGNVLVRGGSGLMYSYLKQWRSLLGNNYKYVGHQDQPSLSYMINETDFGKHVKIIDQSIMNSYSSRIGGPSSYKEGDFLTHYAGYNTSPDCQNLSLAEAMEEDFYKSMNLNDVSAKEISEVVLDLEG